MIDTGSAVPGLPFVNYCGPGSTCVVPDRNGLYFENEARNFDHRESRRDLSANIQWDVTARLKLNFDAQWTEARPTKDDITFATASAAGYEQRVHTDGPPNTMKRHATHKTNTDREPAEERGE